MESNNCVHVKFDQYLCVIQVKDDLEIHEEEEEEDFCISVFSVPKDLLVMKPEAYIPQSVSIGPYHLWRSELYVTKRYKVAAARRYQKRISGGKFESFVEEVRKHEWKIRRFYHKYLDYNEEALAWLMALDAAFVLECLEFYVKMADGASSELKQLGKVLDPSRRSATHNAIIRDLMMLENQVPLFLLQILLQMQLDSQDKAEEMFSNLVRVACAELSPFMSEMPDSSRMRINERSHILEAIYYSVVPAGAMHYTNPKGDEDEQQPLPNATRNTQGLKKALSSLNIGPIRWLTQLPRRLFRGMSVQFVLSAIGNLRFLRGLKECLNLLFGLSTVDKDIAEKGEQDQVSFVETTPTRDELDIPCVCDLFLSGVKFVPTDGDLTSIRFDQSTATLYLPKVKLDGNTEVILRNLVAFEASVAPGTLIFTRYTDFMNGMIDTEEGVRLLRKSGIIYNHLANDGKVASLWNGMGKCVKLTKVKYLDQVIADVNKHYKKKWSVAVREYVKKYIYGSWQFLTLLSAGILLLLNCLQAFCSMYDCKQRWKGPNFN